MLLIHATVVRTLHLFQAYLGYLEGSILQVLPASQVDSRLWSYDHFAPAAELGRRALALLPKLRFYFILFLLLSEVRIFTYVHLKNEWVLYEELWRRI